MPLGNNTGIDGSGDPGKLHSLFQFLEKVQAGTFLAPLGLTLPVLLATL